MTYQCLWRKKPANRVQVPPPPEFCPRQWYNLHQCCLPPPCPTLETTCRREGLPLPACFQHHKATTNRHLQVSLLTGTTQGTDHLVPDLGSDPLHPDMDTLAMDHHQVMDQDPLVCRATHPVLHPWGSGHPVDPHPEVPHPDGEEQGLHRRTTTRTNGRAAALRRERVTPPTRRSTTRRKIRSAWEPRRRPPHRSRWIWIHSA